ncbi:AMP-binding protein [Candidimonas nitroreducens]|uniref:Fatty-acid--CoA ligase n=1 Tax=Candidimonas nitroreducens TaxID=683354 RepID=A0A225MLL2_9BURK|nr:AMP-binding protein [Candidimonas nitroreducens]OWT62065.1 fatty-acid--CoA ligase [Candidimonas nitroreducens]
MLPRRLNLAQVLDDTVQRHPTNEAFVCNGTRDTWATLDDKVWRTAAVLWKLGIRKGDHVGIMLGNSIQWLQAFFACARIGAVTVPVNTRFRTEELRFCLSQADIKALVMADEFLGIDFSALLQEVEPAVSTRLPGANLPRLEHVLVVHSSSKEIPAGAQDFAALVAAAAAADLDAVRTRHTPAAPDDILLIQYTSGTTSFPKGVMLSHDNMLSNAAAVAERMGVRPDDRYFSIRPFFHVAGTTLSVLVSLTAGCCLLTLPRFDVAETLRILDQEKCTLTSGNDTIFLMLMAHETFDPARLHLRGGWAAAGPEVMQKIHDVMRVPGLCNAYGLSEASPNVVFSSWNDPLALRVAGLALPHAGTQVRVVDPESGIALPPDNPGEIQVKGWNVMRGYYNMPDNTAKTFTDDGWLKTGDLGVLNQEGRLRIVGRLKDMLRVGGENVAPSEVEGLLLTHDAIELAQIVGVPDPRLGEVPAAFIVLKSGHHCTEDELIAWCKPRIANFKVPRYVRIVDDFNAIGMTGSSKVQKNKLRAHAITVLGLEGR